MYNKIPSTSFDFIWIWKSMCQRDRKYMIWTSWYPAFSHSWIVLHTYSQSSRKIEDSPVLSFLWASTCQWETDYAFLQSRVPMQFMKRFKTSQWNYSFSLQQCILFFCHQFVCTVVLFSLSFHHSFTVSHSAGRDSASDSLWLQRKANQLGDCRICVVPVLFTLFICKRCKIRKSF